MNEFGTRPGISVVVCCYNSSSKLGPTLAALAAQKFEPTVPFPVEILVIDNASTDGTAAFAANIMANDFPFSHRIISEPKSGKTNALVRGIEAALYSYVCVVDDDNWLDAEYLTTAWKVMENDPAIGMLGGRGTAVPEVSPPVWFDRFAICYAADKQAEYTGDVSTTTRFVYGAGSVLRKSAWDKLQAAGFKFLLRGNTGAMLTSGEDNELCYALIIAGFKIWYDERLVFKHFIPAQRLTWTYVQKLFKAFAFTAATLRPYIEYLERLEQGMISPAGLAKPLVWTRNARLMIKYLPNTLKQTKKDGKMRFREGGLHSMHAACYLNIFVYMLKKELDGNKDYIRVEKFIASIQNLDDVHTHQ